MPRHYNIVPTPEGKCSLCGRIEELRHYGKNAAWVCFDCAMEDEEEAKRQFKSQFLDKPGITVIGMPVEKSKR